MQVGQSLIIEDFEIQKKNTFSNYSKGKKISLTLTRSLEGSFSKMSSNVNNQSFSLDEFEGQSEEEKIEVYNLMYEILDQLSPEEKKNFETLNCLSSLAMINQLQDKKKILKKYFIKMIVMSDLE